MKKLTLDNVYCICAGCYSETKPMVDRVFLSIKDARVFINKNWDAATIRADMITVFPLRDAMDL